MESHEVAYLLLDHDDYWMRQRGTMSGLTAAYMTRLMDDEHYVNGVTIETSDAYAYVESIVASTFSKRPALEVKRGPKAHGNHEVVETCVNQFLFDKMYTVERGLRYALIYPMSFYKLALKEADSVLDAVDIRALHPWDVIIDSEADCWEDMRFVGHRYSLPLRSAQKKYGKKMFNATTKVNYLDGSSSPEETRSQLLGFVEIVEMYDLEEDELIIFCPSLRRDDKILSRDPIPFRHADGSPCCPIAPVYLSYACDNPLRGYSALYRVSDQIFEINNLRTELANLIRKSSRIYAVSEGVLSRENKEMLAANIDQSVVELNVPADFDIRAVMQPLPTVGISGDYSFIDQLVRADFERGSLLLSAARGQMSGATATEVDAAVHYSATELGRITRFFHNSMEEVGKIYQSLAHFYLKMVAEEDVEVVLADRTPVVIRPEAFDGKFGYAFADQATSPVTDSLRQKKFLETSQALAALGADPRAMLEYLVNILELPESFIPPKETTQQEAPTTAAEVAPAPAPVQGVDGPGKTL